MRPTDHPVTPLEAGAGAENPPCPACGEPLFGWALIGPGMIPVRRCELCGMAVAGGPASRDEALAALSQQAAGGARWPNRRSLQAWIGSSGWAGLEPETRFCFTPDAMRRLGAVPARPGYDFAGMWQTLINSFTFGHNLALERLGRAGGNEAEPGWQRRLDWLITVVVALPLALVATVAEALAALAGRGGRFRMARGPE